MLFKIQKRLLCIKSVIDFCEYTNNVLKVKGWMFSSKYQIQNIKVIIKSSKGKFPIIITSGIKRSDVYKETQVENAKNSGFYGKILVENIKEFEVSIAFDILGKNYKYSLGKFESEEKVNQQEQPKVQEINSKDQEIDLKNVILADQGTIGDFQEEYYKEKIDIIVPIYNGYHFFEKLFSSIELTKIPYRLIIINDKSSDKRVSPYLHQYADQKDNVVLIENEVNLGFVKTVNKGLSLSKGHVVLVNSDVELPAMWLERLMLPIFKCDKVASATPFTNCGIITSFPEIGQDNDLFKNLTLQEIDDEFQKVLPRYVSMPTGVGFCMAMNKKAIAEVGVLDADSFGKGYGEENDWCQRAIKKGYKNVHVENLFVYHKHGGSFLSEDKKRYMEEHSRILEKKYPDYNKQVARFFTIDENKDIRQLVQYKLIRKSKQGKTIVAFDHDLGGGATSYLVGKKNLAVDSGNAFYIIRYNYIQNYYPILFYYGENKMKFSIKNQRELFEALEFMNADEGWINELVTYPKLYDLMGKIREYSQKNQVPIKMLLHDYFAICPSINLLDVSEKYCNIPECDICESCFKKCDPTFSEEFGTMVKWRLEWKTFLEACNEVVAFSESSKAILERVYGRLDNVVVIPHQIGYMPKIQKKYKLTNSLVIGVLGVLTKHKGGEIIKDLIAEIEEEGLNIKIALIGSSTEKINSPIFKETGKYSRDSIPRLTLKQDIDIFLIPSIWPETFSYTAEEIMKMDMPIMCFNIGAPAERVAQYQKGMVIPEISAKAILEIIKNQNVIANCLKLERKNKKVLFVVEEDSFATRYRVEHLREQLLVQGIDSRRIMISCSDKCELDGYQSIVLYRVSKIKQVQKLVKSAHKLGKLVYYDMDDYIFEYSKIKDLLFLEGKEYKNYEQYSDDIRKSMELCDGYIVSTIELKEKILNNFPEKPVYVNRNVASMAMDICSLDNQHKKEENRIYLGYFSGTKTHNEDFESIKNQIIDIMKENDNVYLLIGGQITLPEEFNNVKKRVERFKFVVWRNLPRLIAKADINLMPLETTDFHNCKSENKWMEAALVKVPTVATWNSELARVIDHGVNGYLCHSETDWKNILQKLIDSPKLREEIADNAYQKAMAQYTTSHIEPDVLDALIR